jgi:hypothetical protein
VIELRRLEQRFGGNAADVETGPTKLVRLDQRYFQTELCGSDGGRIAAHTAAKDCDVEIKTRHLN